MVRSNKSAEKNVVPGIGKALDQYFVEISTGCPYGLEKLAVYYQAVFGGLDSATMGCFLANGYRRNGNCLYTMHCPGCQACVPIRLRPEEFKPSRSQRRVWKKNSDVAVGVAPLTMSNENLVLLDRFLHTRFPNGKSDAESYYAGFFVTSMTRCFEIRYRVAGELLGVAIVDGSSDWLNAVYFYFDPDQAWRSPGTLNILYMINFCKNQQIPLCYLGYWIKEVQSMQYKAAFQPHETLIDGKWGKISRE